MKRRVVNRTRSQSPFCDNGFTLVEVMIVMVIIAVLATFAMPSFDRSMEQSRGDIAAANLRAIWAAERLYWLEQRTYTSDLADLTGPGLLDAAIAAGTTHYVYNISQADADTFTAAATRTGSGVWTGSFSIDETGDLSGAVSAAGEYSITPAFE